MADHGKQSRAQAQDHAAQASTETHDDAHGLSVQQQHAQALSAQSLSAQAQATSLVEQHAVTQPMTHLPASASLPTIDGHPHQPHPHTTPPPAPLSHPHEAQQSIPHQHSLAGTMGEEAGDSDGVDSLKPFGADVPAPPAEPDVNAQPNPPHTPVRTSCYLT